LKRKIYLISGMIPVLLALMLGGCTTTPKINASPGQEFTLAIGQSAGISGENLTIEFVSVTADSRCPQGVTCVWAGEVSCIVKITLAGKAPFNLVIKQPGASDTPASQVFDGHTMAFKVTPYPTAGKKIADKEYRLTMTVNKAL
jgi:hypothetical protein